MIFNEKFNNIIDLMQETDSEFNEVYAEFARRLPESIIKKCQICKNFDTEIENIDYDLETNLNNGNTIELSVDDFNKDIGFLLTVELFTKETLDRLEICKDNEDQETKSWKLGEFEIDKSNKLIKYNFTLKKTDYKQFCVVSEKTVKTNKLKIVKKEEKIYSYKELLNKIIIPTSKK